MSLIPDAIRIAHAVLSEQRTQYEGRTPNTRELLAQAVLELTQTRHPIQIARHKAGWSVAELARICGVHPQHIRDIEAGKKRPSTLLAGKLRTACEPHLDGVFFETRDVGRPRRAAG